VGYEQSYRLQTAAGCADLRHGYQSGKKVTAAISSG
jgi:hypothetical protein